MVSEDKVRQIISSLKENDISNFDDEQFMEMLSLLSKLELALFKDILTKEEELEILTKYEILEDKIIGAIDDKLIEVDETELISLFKASLLTNQYIEYLSALNINDLQTIRFYVSNRVNVNNKDNVNGSIKLLRIISKLLKEKETHKLTFAD